MPQQDLTTYTETDPNSHITVTASRVTYSGLTRNEDAYVYKDFGINYFSGDFTHKFTGYINSAAVSDPGAIGAWMLTNDIDDFFGLQNTAKDFLVLQINTGVAGSIDVLLRERYSSTYYGGTTYSLGVSSTPITLYFTIWRDEAVGTYGTLYLDIYSDAARTTIVHSTSLALHAKLDFRYLFALNSSNGGVTAQSNGYNESFDLDSVHFTATGGAIAGGASDYLRSMFYTASGGGIVGGSVNYLRSMFYTADGGGIIGGSANYLRTMFFNSSGGGIVGGNASYTFNGGGNHTMDGGGIAGGSADYVRTASFTATGGAVAGGTVPYSFTINSNIQEVIWEVYDQITGNPVTGAAGSTTIKFRRTPDGKIYDWADSTFKSSGWSSITSTLSEIDATNMAGAYKKEIDVAALIDGRYQVFVAYTASTPIQRGSIEFLVKDGAIWDVHTSDNVDVASSTRLAAADYTAPDNAGIVAIQTKVNFFEQWILNMLTITNNGDGTETVVLWNDAGTSALKTWVRVVATNTRNKAT